MEDEESFRILMEGEEDDLHHQGMIFRDDEDEEEKMECRSAGGSSVDSDGEAPAAAPSAPERPSVSFFVDPEPHISSQFYTFNEESHNLMVRSITERRYATPDEIRRATPAAVLASWRGVWKDRNEDTAYLTGWKRIQDKLGARPDPNGRGEVLFFKNNPNQFVSHINQWQDIVMRFHGDADLRHLGLKDTIERIKQVWTVGAKFYGIPESFIRVCVTSCPVCSGTAGPGNSAAAAAPRTKRRRFEYTDSFEVAAREVPSKLQQLAAKHKVVLCIRQKYIRYKPFMAEVKDYACHRAGEPNTKRAGVLKRERYASKRCGCGFRIRAIVPITNYNEKDKSFSYLEEGKAIFKLYAVHSGHEPGPHEGSARVIHRFVGNALENTFEEPESSSSFSLVGKVDPEARLGVLNQVQELKMEIGFLESKIGNLSNESLLSLSHDLCAITQRLRNIDEVPRAGSENILVENPNTLEWDNNGQETKTGDSTFGDGAVFAEKWMDSVKEACSDFDEKSILVCEDSKLCKQDEDELDADGNLVGMQVDGFYPENPKWYERIACGLDPSADDLAHSVQEGFRHGGIA